MKLSILISLLVMALIAIGTGIGVAFIPPESATCRAVLAKDIQERSKLSAEDRKLSALIEQSAPDYLTEIKR